MLNSRLTWHKAKLGRFNVKSDMINNFIEDQSFEQLGYVTEKRYWTIILNLTAVTRFVDKSVLVGLDTTKTIGLDGIPPIVLSTCASALYKPLHYLFSMCLNSDYLPLNGNFTKSFVEI